MVPNDNRRERRSGRPRRRPERISVEGLETRQLMAYSPFGYSLPQLAVSGFSARNANWGGSLTVDVTVQNQGASSLVEPLDLAPGSTNNTLNTPSGTSTNSTADSTPTTVEVYASSRPGASTRNLIDLGSISIPSVTQNSSYETQTSINLPARPAGYGNKLYLTFVVNNNQSILQISQSQNVYHVPLAVRLGGGLPDLQVAALDIPSQLQAGDVIAPTVQIVNLGTSNISAQGPVKVDLVASLNKTFGPGDSVVGSFVIDSLPGISGVPTQSATPVGSQNLIPTPNVYTYTFPALKLPSKPGKYFLGIVIDPTHAINQSYAPNAALRNVVVVGPPDPLLGPTTLQVNTNGVPIIFPALPSSVIGPVITNDTLPNLYPPTGTTTSLTGGSSGSTVHAASFKFKKKG